MLIADMVERTEKTLDQLFYVNENTGDLCVYDHISTRDMATAIVAALEGIDSAKEAA
jgi:hypothetical protein